MKRPMISVTIALSILMMIMFAVACLVDSALSVGEFGLLRRMWPGFAINVLVGGVLIWLICLSVVFLNSRRRRSMRGRGHGTDHEVSP